MSKTRIFALVLISVLIGSVLTNPPKEEVEAALAQKANTIIKQQFGYQDQLAVDLAMQLVGDKMIHDLIERNIVIENYFLCSIIKVKWSGEETIVGVSAFKNVWLSGKTDKKIDDIIQVLQSL